LEGAGVECGGDFVEEGLIFEGLGDVGVDAGFEGGGKAVFVGECGYEDDGDVACGFGFSEAVHGGEAVHVGHEVVEEDEVGVFGFGEVEALAAVGGGEDFVAAAAEAAAEDG